MDKLVVCVWKYPIVWKVKTRLWEIIWMEQAMKIQKKFLQELIKNNYKNKNNHNIKYNYDFKICLSPIEKGELFEKEFWVHKKDIFASKWSDLGVMMTNIFHYGFKQWYTEIILIGSDLATLHSQDFIAWFDILKKNDIVLGEALDWGYYLVGMKKMQEKIFQDIVYSTETVLAETLQKCRENNLSFGLLEWKMDIDGYQDLLEEAEKDTTGFYKKIIDEI